MLIHILVIPQFSRPNEEEQQLIKRLTLANVKPRNVMDALFDAFKNSTVSAAQLQRCMFSTRKNNMNGMDDINFFMQKLKGDDVHLVPADVRFANNMTGKILLSADWAFAYEQDDTGVIYRMALFHKKGI